MTTQPPPYYTIRSLASECGASLRTIQRHLQLGTCRINKAAEKIPGVGVRINAQLASKFIAVMQAKKSITIPTA
jgi:hypothetical protein